MALLGSLGTSVNQPIPLFADLQTAIVGVKNNNIRDVLSTCLAEAQGDITKLRNGVAAWFDDSMDRLSGAYKRYFQIISIAIGLIIAAAFNADTLHVANALWKDPTFSGEIAQSAGQIVKTDSGVQETAACPKPKADELSKRTHTLCLLNTELRPPPIGWTQCPKNCTEWLLKILGLLATAIALSRGAPFWFDLLKQFVNLRATEGKPDPTKTS
jgi:hypothetical protein